jgi:hypothetical protein
MAMWMIAIAARRVISGSGRVSTISARAATAEESFRAATARAWWWKSFS